MKKVASLRYGVIFKKAFCNPEIFSAFARDMTGVEIEIDKVETEKEFEPTIGYVKSRFDLFGQDNKNRVIVDIQHERYGDHYDRFMHYHLAAILEQVANAKDYFARMTVFTIVVLTSGDRHKKDIVTTDFDPKDRNGNSLGEIKHKLIYLCPKYATHETPEPFRSWMFAIQDTIDEEVDESLYKSSLIHKIFNYIEKDNVTPSERATMFDEYGKELLYEEKITKERANGKVEGCAEERQKIAHLMLESGINENIVMNLTGLLLEEIMVLRK